jgi:hypothetical protein
MLGINLKHSIATVAVAAGLLASAGSAGAATHPSGLVVYNGHADLGASVYQHDQTDLELLDALDANVTDGTSNTIAFGARVAALKGFSIDVGTSERIAADGHRADHTLGIDLAGPFTPNN